MTTEQQLDQLAQAAATCLQKILALERVARFHNQQIQRNASKIARLQQPLEPPSKS